MKYTLNKIIAGLAVLVVVGVGIFLAVYFFGANQNELGPQIENQQTQQPDSDKIPVHLSIAKIGVEAEVDPAGLAPDGTVAVPSGPEGVTWYELGTKPGEKGSAVLTGHFGPWRSGEGSVFDNLNQLERGDRVTVKNQKGDLLTFEVYEKKMYGKNEVAPEVFIKDDASYLNIVTCSGEWLANQQTFTNRLVVFTKLVE